MIFKSLKRKILVLTASIALVGAVLLLSKPIYTSNFKPKTYLVTKRKSASLSSTDLNKMAKYELIFDFGTNFSQSQIKFLHKKNPHTRVVRYLNVAHVFEGADFNEINQEHPKWFLHDMNGKRVKTKLSKAFVMDSENKGFQNWLSQKISNLVNFGYDGIAADAFYYPPFPPYSNYYETQPINPQTGKGFSSSDWLSAKDDLLKALKNSLGNKLLVVNGYATGRAYYRYGAGGLLNIADGVWAEGFIRWANDNLGNFRSKGDWKKDIDMLKELSAKGKIIITETKFLSGQENTPLANKIKVYAFGSYLLGADGRSYFELNTVDAQNYWHNESLPFRGYNLKIGNPLGRYYYKNHLYQRNFTGGKVFVNPNTKSFRINLGRSYVTLSGKQIKRKITIKPHSAVILMKK